MAGANGGGRKSGPTKAKGTEKMSYARRKQLEKVAAGKAKAEAAGSKAAAGSGAGLARASTAEFAGSIMAEAQNIARSGTSAEKFGDDLPWAGPKVFISALYDRMKPSGMSMDAFKMRLVDAHRAGHIRLSRADLVEAMPARSVDRSETNFDGSSFHFVNTR